MRSAPRSLRLGAQRIRKSTQSPQQLSPNRPSPEPAENSFVTDVGLNGVLVNEGETKRTFTLQALPNAEPIDQIIYVSGDVETRAAGQQNAILSEPIRLRVKATQVSMK